MKAYKHPHHGPRIYLVYSSGRSDMAFVKLPVHTYLPHIRVSVHMLYSAVSSDPSFGKLLRFTIVTRRNYRRNMLASVADETGNTFV